MRYIALRDYHIGFSVEQTSDCWKMNIYVRYCHFTREWISSSYYRRTLDEKCCSYCVQWYKQRKVNGLQQCKLYHRSLSIPQFNINIFFKNNTVFDYGHGKAFVQHLEQAFDCFSVYYNWDSMSFKLKVIISLFIVAYTAGCSSKKGLQLLETIEFTGRVFYRIKNM